MGETNKMEFPTQEEGTNKVEFPPQVGENLPMTHPSLSSCTLCPRACRADRTAGRRGACHADSDVRLARAALHYWEEPPISGTCGSGTVFFSGCALGCAYCQNAHIASGEIGRTVSIERLAEIFLELQDKGAHNINLVTPTHYALQIREALDLARPDLRVPIVWNTGGYETPETIALLDGYVDVFLTDFKYASSELAARYSSAPDYPEAASRALDAMHAMVDQARFASGEVGDAEPPEGALMTRGIIVRHLMLPGHLNDSMAVIDLLAEKPYAGDLWLSLMSQYTPMPGITEKFPELADPVREDDYLALVDHALSRGFERSFMQECGSVGESFIPDFDYEGV